MGARLACETLRPGSHSRSSSRLWGLVHTGMRHKRPRGGWAVLPLPRRDELALLLPRGRVGPVGLGGSHEPAAAHSARSFFLRLCSEVPILEDTLMRILVIGLSRELPLGPADAMELADHLVKRAAAVQADGEGLPPPAPLPGASPGLTCSLHGLTRQERLSPAFLKGCWQGLTQSGPPSRARVSLLVGLGRPAA